MKKSKPENKNQELPNLNLAAAARRRMIRALGGSGAVALTSLAVNGWQKPVVRATVLPAHAQSSAICQIGATFSHEDLPTRSATVCIEILGPTGVVEQGCTDRPTTTPINVFPTMTGSESVDAGPGTYTVNFLWSYSSGELTYTVACCGGTGFIDVVSPNVGGGRTDSVVLTVSDDGECALNIFGP